MLIIKVTSTQSRPSQRQGPYGVRMSLTPIDAMPDVIIIIYYLLFAHSLDLWPFSAPKNHLWEGDPVDEISV